ncbi:MAG TPA: PfkB family carbohydrate kinase [Gaiellaceae bacterium]
MSEPVLFLGETLVDLICERPPESWSEADSFVPHCGGAPTNAAIVAARCGAAVALAGGAGDDHWGRWLEDRLRAEKIDLRWWKRVPAVQTGVAFDVIDGLGVPDFLIYGQGIEPALEALEPELEDAVSASSALELGSNTLLGERELAISLRARELALESDKPLIVDVNLRLSRWESPAQAVNVVLQLCAGAFLVKVNHEEARLLSGEDDPARAAEVLCAQLGARVVVVTLGAAGALMRGEAQASVKGVPAKAVDTTGAGDALLGVLVAALAGSAFDAGAAAEALPLAVTIAARSTERFGAVEALPSEIVLSNL